jgi:hypothetical protein
VTLGVAVCAGLPRCPINTSTVTPRVGTDKTQKMAPAPAPEPTYRKDEKVFCFHHELLYESKVLDVKPMEGEDRKSGFQYRVHYKGWKNT